MAAPHHLFCQCDTCIAKEATEHAAGDAACGRKWTCQCGFCRDARRRGLSITQPKPEEK